MSKLSDNSRIFSSCFFLTSSKKTVTKQILSPCQCILLNMTIYEGHSESNAIDLISCSIHLTNI